MRRSGLVGEDFAGVEDAGGIEGLLDPPGQRQNIRREIVADVPFFCQTDAVFAADGAAQ